MFVQHDLSVPLPPDEAEARLCQLVAGEGLHGVSEAAYGTGVEVIRRVGPIGPVTKQVRVRWLEPRRWGPTLVFPLRWEATGASGALFPTLDANLGVTAVNQTSSLLSIVAAYHPPLGAVGERLDRLLLHRAATATLHSLLRHLADQMLREATVPPAEPRARAVAAVKASGHTA